jgi:hypothetical protein
VAQYLGIGHPGIEHRRRAMLESRRMPPPDADNPDRGDVSA